MSSAIRTRSGLDFDPLAPDPGRVRIEDIAHALSNICRFTGHTKHFYSVAQHSVLVSDILCHYRPEIQMMGLLHDATEAYLNDIARPLKISPVMDLYRKAETRLERVLANVFDLPEGFSNFKEVKKADQIALATEARDLMGNPKWEVLRGVNAIPMTIREQSPNVAKDFFLERFHELKGNILAYRSNAL